VGNIGQELTGLSYPIADSRGTLGGFSLHDPWLPVTNQSLQYFLINLQCFVMFFARRHEQVRGILRITGVLDFVHWLEFQKIESTTFQKLDMIPTIDEGRRHLLC
jgi:hypothetical protein